MLLESFNLSNKRSQNGSPVVFSECTVHNEAARSAKYRVPTWQEQQETYTEIGIFLMGTELQGRGLPRSDPAKGVLAALQKVAEGLQVYATRLRTDDNNHSFEHYRDEVMHDLEKKLRALQPSGGAQASKSARVNKSVSGGAAAAATGGLGKKRKVVASQEQSGQACDVGQGGDGGIAWPSVQNTWNANLAFWHDRLRKRGET